MPLGYVKLYLLFCIVTKKLLHKIRWSILLDIIIYMFITELDEHIRAYKHYIL